jgi:hypothetical protein
MVRGCLPEHSTVALKTRNLDAARLIRCRDVGRRTSLTVPVQAKDHRQDLMFSIL